jgi:hypothetical protein
MGTEVLTRLAYCKESGTSAVDERVYPLHVGRFNKTARKVETRRQGKSGSLRNHTRIPDFWSGGVQELRHDVP